MARTNRRLVLLSVASALTAGSAIAQTAPAAGAEQAPPSAAPNAPAPDASAPAPKEVESSSTPAGDATESNKPKVVMPEVVHYEPPVYPPAAAEQGIEAKVRLVLTLDATGVVTKAEVPEPVGQGFDEAAQAAALKLTFTPALVNGVARSVKIPFEYSFSIEKKVEEAPPEAPKLGQIGGVILVANSDQPLPGVEVVVADATGSEYRATTNDDGRWQLESMPAGTYTVYVALDGFAPVELDETVAAGEATELTYRLSAATEEMEIVVGGERPPREVTRRVLERREIERIPGTSGDALRSLQSLPGVARPPALAGLLIVRGSAPEDTQTFVDGTNVPLIYHFGGLSSVVPTEMLDRIDFYPGNYSVRYGRGMGGIVDVGLRTPNTDCYGDYGTVETEANGSPKRGCYHAMAQADLIDIRAMVQGPVGESKEWSFAAAGRRSWLDAWLGPALEAGGSTVTNAPVYYDYQFVLDRTVGPGDRLSLRFYGSDDRFKAIINDPAAQDPAFGGSLSFGTSFTRGQILYQKTLSSRVGLDTMVSVGTTDLDFSLGGNFLFNLHLVPIEFRSEFNFKLTETTTWNVGLDYEGGPYEVLVRAPPPPRPGEASPPPFVTQQPLETRQDGFGFRPGWYTDVEWQPAKRLRVVPGARLDFARDSGHADFSPRVNARYALVLPEDNFWFGEPLATTLKAGIGVFQQPPQYQETDAVFGTPNIESNRSIQYSLGVEQGLTRQIDLNLDGFYKDMTNLVSRTADASGHYIYDNVGSGYVIGLETLLKYHPDDRFFGWISYTLSRSVRQDLPNSEQYLFQYDQTHNLIILGSYRLGGGWEAGARFRLVSGPLDTPTDTLPNLAAIYVADAGSYTPQQGKQFSARMPLFHQLDVRIDKRWQFREWRLSTYLDVQNVYNNAAYESYTYNYNFTQRSYQTGLPIIPSIGVRGEF